MSVPESTLFPENTQNFSQSNMNIIEYHYQISASRIWTWLDVRIVRYSTGRYSVIFDWQIFCNVSPLFPENTQNLSQSNMNIIEYQVRENAPTCEKYLPVEYENSWIPDFWEYLPAECEHSWIWLLRINASDAPPPEKEIMWAQSDVQVLNPKLNPKP